MVVVVIRLVRMRLKFNIKHLLLSMLVVSIGLFLHLGLDNAVSTMEHEITNTESSLHDVAKQKMTSEYSAMMVTAYNMTVDNVTLKADPTIADYCLFRRTIQCHYNLNVDYLRREIAHSRIPQDRRVDGHYVDVPSQHRAQHTVYVTATPFGYTIMNQ